MPYARRKFNPSSLNIFSLGAGYITLFGMIKKAAGSAFAPDVLIIIEICKIGTIAMETGAKYGRTSAKCRTCNNFRTSNLFGCAKRGKER